MLSVAGTVLLIPHHKNLEWFPPAWLADDCKPYPCALAPGRWGGEEKVCSPASFLGGGEMRCLHASFLTLRMASLWINPSRGWVNLQVDGNQRDFSFGGKGGRSASN